MSTTSGNAVSHNPALSLAIVGGGITGLLAAISTSNHSPHIPITLYESAHKFGEIGAGVALGPNAARAMSKIAPEAEAGFDRVRSSNLSEDLRDVYFSFRVGMDGKTDGIKEGEEYFKHYFRGVAKDSKRGMVHRAAFLDEMVKVVPETVKIEFSKRLVDLKDEGADGVVLKFQDGTEARHAAVVGSDGIKSRTRVLLLGDDDPAAHAVFTGKYCYRGLIPMEEAIEAIGEQQAANSTMYSGYGGHILTFPVQKGKVMNVVAFSSAAEWDNHEWVVHADREKMFKDYEAWGPTAQKILRMMQKTDIWALFNHLPAKSYHNNSRVCVMGDAAHASTPHQGSGAGMAVEDAYVLGMILQKVKQPTDFTAAFAAFDKVRRPRTQRLVTTSAEMGHLLDFEGEGIGDDLSKMRENMDPRMDWIWDKELDEDVDEALRAFEVFNRG